jgi:hypothetical protein
MESPVAQALEEHPVVKRGSCGYHLDCQIWLPVPLDECIREFRKW